MNKCNMGPMAGLMSIWVMKEWNGEWTCGCMDGCNSVLGADWMEWMGERVD
jgi:hypothetical protein